METPPVPDLVISDPDTVNALLDRVFVPDMLISREITTPVEVTVANRFVEIVVDELLQM